MSGVMTDKPFGRGTELSHQTLTFVPASTHIRPTQDHILVQPLPSYYSEILEVITSEKPLRGRVLAVGPGIYPKRYDHSDKHKRTKYWEGVVFRRTQVKVGELVDLGGVDVQGQSFQSFQTLKWGDKFCIVASERDITAIIEDEHAAA